MTKKILFLGLFSLIFLLTVSVNLTSAESISTRLRGRILLQVEEVGEAWYINPSDDKRYYLGRPKDAMGIMSDLGLGISEVDYGKFLNNNNKASDNLKGRILLRVEANGEAYYVHNTLGFLLSLGRPENAFSVMRDQGLGITNNDLEKIVLGSDVFESKNNEIKKQEGVVEKKVLNNYDEILVDGIPLHRDLETGSLIPLCTLENKCERYKNVSIYWTCDDRHLPASLKTTDGYRLVCSPLLEESIARAIALTKKAIDKYPEHVLNGCLNRAYMIGGLILNEGGVSGVVDTPNKTIFVTASFGNGDAQVEQTFHHELSSTFLLKDKTDLYDRFRELNDSEFEYTLRGWASRNPEEDEEFLQAGFAMGYGRRSLEDDLNTFAQSMFRDTPVMYGRFWEKLDSGRYPKLRAKFDVIVEFYHSLDPIFTEEYFRKIK